jgi:RNA polymerase sigma factor (sigma-70 family)
VKAAEGISLNINELQTLARTGDQSAEEQLFSLLAARFRLFARLRIKDRADAEDVVQDTLRTILEKHLQVDFETSFQAWAYRILNNKIMTYLTTRKRREDILNDLSEQHGRLAVASPDSELVRRLLDCLQKLHRVHHRHARILNLQHQGYSVDEICNRIGLTRTNFYTLLSRARTLLETCLEKGSIR